MKDIFSNKKILITGGTGSLGYALTLRLLKTKASNIRIFSRDEGKQTEMAEKITDQRLRFLIGDVRDKSRLSRALENIDIVIHAAALKQIPVAEYNPFEAVKTNVYGTQNLVEACLENDVSKVIAIGTDKAVSPFNTYGATKFLMERLVISANRYRGNKKTDFLCVRYGNVLGSRGSVVPIFIEQIKNNKKITITDPNMTRFTITMNQAIDVILRALETGFGGEVFVPKLESYRLIDVKDAIIEIFKAKNNLKKIPVRLGEKIHESLISSEELRNCYETKLDYILCEEILDVKKRNLKKTKSDISYTSNNVKILNKNEIKNILRKEKLV